MPNITATTSKYLDTKRVALLLPETAGILSVNSTCVLYYCIFILARDSLTVQFLEFP